MNNRKFYIILIIFILGQAASAQTDSLARIQLDTLIFGRKPLLLSQKNPIPESISLRKKADQLSVVQHKIVDSNSILLIDTTTISEGDTLLCSYRFYADILPDSLGRKYKSGIESLVNYIALDIPKNTENRALLPEGVNYSGSFGRGLTAGNSQSLVLNSNFNLQLGGQIGDGIDLRAVISDANIPIQAEGTTQQLQEFDQVFIELSKGDQSLIAGDYRLERPTGYFVNYSKKLKGISYQNDALSTDIGKVGVGGSFAISGGKFSRNQLAISEGNQGPYKLQGADNEQFIIVQSGSEKIYVDGELLTRGENNDYVIFYDRAEILFTEKRPITKDVRVIIEIEYLVQNYARTISTANADWKIKKNELRFRMYNETDSKNSSGLFELTAEDKIFLSEAGDDPSKSFKSGIFVNENYDENGVFYLVEIQQAGDTVLVFSQNPALARYQAIFTDLGENGGDYIIDPSNNINGRVYQYVGKGNGRYQPVRKLSPPESKQMYSIGNKYNYNKNGAVDAEFSLSNFDRNLFSSVDSDDDLSFAAKMIWDHKWTIKKHSLAIAADGEFLDQDFNFLNPFRNAEFARDWNVKSTADRSRELLGGTSVGWAFAQNSIEYGLKAYQQSTNYQGVRHSGKVILKDSLTSFRAQSSFLQTNSNEFNSSFIRPQMNLDRQWSRLADLHTGVEYDGEYNSRYDAGADTLLQESNEYDVLKVYVKSKEDGEIQTSAYYSKRLDRIAFKNEQREFSRADNYGASVKWTGKNQGLNMTVNYRVLETDETLGQSIEDAKNVLGGIDYQYSLWKGIVRGVSNLNFNSGQEPKREFDYREVAAGEGNFIWIDNGDGVQDKNEFQAAPFSDQGNFIQISLFNNEFIQVYKQDYSQTLRIDPIQWKISKSKWKKSISRLSSQTSLRLSRKDLQEAGLPNFNFIQFEPTDINLVSYVASVNQNFYWNRGNPSYDFVFSFIDNKTSLLLTNGNELRNDQQYSLKYRQNLYKKGELQFYFETRNKGLENINFSENNYSISGWQGKISGSYRYKNDLAFRLETSYLNKENTLGLEKSNAFSLVAGSSYANSKRTRIDIKTEYRRIQYDSDNNPTVELIMLEGLKDGNNFLWELQFTRRLINNFDLTLSYNGRKTSESRVINVANAQIKVTF